ncbi:MAG: hypothetical protein LBR96_04990 [Treponema sp.]|jgi:hypothetical protein|nr:hypothetical protein [Treponema sp.]
MKKCGPSKMANFGAVSLDAMEGQGFMPVRESGLRCRAGFGMYLDRSGNIFTPSSVLNVINNIFTINNITRPFLLVNDFFKIP